MHTKERFVVYGALAGLAALVAFQMPAHTASTLRADLGPAEGLILTGKDQNITLKNGEGRLQWGEQATAKSWSAGAVHSDKIMKLLLKSDRLTSQRQTLEDEAKQKEEDFAKRYKDFREKYKDLDRNSPAAEDAQRESEAFQKEYYAWRNDMSQKFAKMQTEHIEKAYRDLTAAVDLVSERQKIDMVFRFVPTAAKFESDQSSDEESGAEGPMDSLIKTMDQVRARTFLRYPEAIDITSEVMKELGLKDE